MLKQRVWAALALILAFSGALFFLSSELWAGLIGLVALGAAWEWSRLCSLSGLSRGLYALAIGMVLTLCFAFADAPFQQGIWLLALLFWLGLAPLWLYRHWVMNRPVLLFAGLIILVPTGLAFVYLREINAVLLLFLMGLVWVADSAAYFTGRQWGRHKLAPGISPGKTWEGVAGALIVALVYAAAWHELAPGTLARFSAIPWWGQGLAAMLLVVISIIGDLFESHLKRIAGLKDSGNLIPGHGGILDRIDSQTSVLPVAMALIFFAGLAS